MFYEQINDYFLTRPRRVPKLLKLTFYGHFSAFLDTEAPTEAHASNFYQRVYHTSTPGVNEKSPQRPEKHPYPRNTQNTERHSAPQIRI